MVTEDLRKILEEAETAFQQAREVVFPKLSARQAGTVSYVGSGIALVRDLHGVLVDEILVFADGTRGLAFNLDRDLTGAVLLGDGAGIGAGGEVRGEKRVLDFPVSETLVGRVVDALGNPLDGLGAIIAAERWPVERPAPGIMDRAPVTEPLASGIKVVDALIPIGRGQRELILGDRQTGKTAIALDAIINQQGRDVLCIYCAIGKRSSAVAKVIADLKECGAMNYTTVVMSSEDDPPGLQFSAPYAAMSLGEYHMSRGRDVLVVLDDLTRHARAYRELSLLLRRPPGREAFPGDIFYIHARLLERSTHLREEHGGGSLTTLPIVETEAQNISAYIPTNLISITDGQIYLSPELFRKGILPAVDVGRSVSRVGGKTQLAAYRAVTGDLKLAYSQFEELEAFSRFGTRLDEDTRKTLDRGRRIRAVLKQKQYNPMPAAHQIAILVAVNQGVFDGIEPERIGAVEEKIRKKFDQQFEALTRKIEAGEKLTGEELQSLAKMAGKQVENW